MFPPFLLAKLYVKGTLKNTADGFEFDLKNIIDATMLVGIGPITVGEKSYEAPSMTLAIGDKAWQGAEISKQNPVPVRMGIPLKITIHGEPLAAGPQRLSLTATSSDIGKIKFDINDTIG
jgi:hypothetical protein